MREYDDHIRLYTPILQRIIILVAVIIAVPVVLWTITAFVRAYVAPPQLPIFRPMAANPAPAPATPAPPVQVATQTANTTIASDARGPMLDIKKPAGSDAAQAGPPAAPPATQQMAGTTAAAPPPAPSVAPLSGPSGVPPPPFVATRSLSTTTAAPANVALANVAAPAVPGPSPPAVAWPNPAANANSGSDTADTAASQGQTAANDSSVDDLPPAAPLKGKIPLPPHRPRLAALTNVALAGGPGPPMLPGVVTPAGIPLPRARPASAPEPAPVSAAPYQHYDPSEIH